SRYIVRRHDGACTGAAHLRPRRNSTDQYKWRRREDTGAVTTAREAREGGRRVHPHRPAQLGRTSSKKGLYIDGRQPGWAMYPRCDVQRRREAEHPWPWGDLHTREPYAGTHLNSDHGEHHGGPRWEMVVVVVVVSGRWGSGIAAVKLAAESRRVSA
ncbi:hypothetical protein C8T65DRAFT_656154, partial [Cerioporus squamosus]